MKEYIIILIFLFATANIFAQSDWHFEKKIERNNHYLLEGSIADKYPITMFLEPDKFCYKENRWNYAYQLRGWYYYNNYKIKLPLIGSVKYIRPAEDDSFYGTIINLYNPENESDTIDSNTCEIENFKEIFSTEINDGQSAGCSFETLQWRPSGNKSFLPVKLKTINRPSIATKSSISLYIRDTEILAFDLSDKLKDLKDIYGNTIGGDYIETIKLEASKKIDNDFYLIFSFSQPSSPGSNGFGHCGAGYENYVGFLHISSFKVKDFNYFQTYSCLKVILEEYTFDKNAPEKGITVKL